MKKYGYGVALLAFLFFGVSYSSAFIEFFISPNLSSFTLASLASSSSVFTISFDNSSATPDEGGDHPYRIERRTVCNQYDENYDCIDAPPDLCPYLTLEPNNPDEDENGFQLNASSPGVTATGFLISLTDEADDWTLSVTSPCFENECPANYDPSINGAPLSQSIKGQTFKCNLATIWNGNFQSRGLTKTAYADITNEMTVEAVLTGETEQHIDPVIIIPGIMGSYLNREDGTEVWMNIPKMLLPGGDTYLDELILSTSGEQINTPSLQSNDIIKNTGSEDFFDGLISNLKNNDYVENESLFVFPYDWRLDVGNNALDLKEKIKEIVSQTHSNKINIVAHSMGGLIVREYLKNYGGNSLEKFIDVGTPHNGASKSFKILMYGDDLNASILFNLLGLNSQRVKTISQNMPSVYQLLPSMGYGTYLYDLDDLDGNGVSGALSYTQTKEFMKNMGRNALLVDRAEQFHQEVDNINPADYGVETYNIVGCGTPTLDKIFILDKEASGGVEYNISYANGDGTVPLKSAEALSADKTYYLKNATHALMPSTAGVKELIAGILETTDIEDFDISPYPNLSTTSSGCTIPNGKIVSFHSPIELHIYSGDKHVGPNANGDIENNIEGVDYEVIDGNKFAFLPDGQDYTIEGVATDSGTFTARIQKVVDEAVTETEVFSNVPLTDTTLVEVGSNTLSIDTDANGQPDRLIFSDDTDLATIIKALKNKIQSLNIKDKLKKNLLNKIENIEKKIAKKQKKDKSLESLKIKIQNIINKVVKYESKGKIGDVGAQDVVNLLEQIETKL